MTDGTLRLREVFEGDGLASWATESPTNGVMILSVTVGQCAPGSPLHWRAGDWTKPPLDVEIDPVSGSVQALQLVLQDELVPIDASLAEHATSNGMPIVEITDWPADRYRDVRCDVRFSRGPGNEFIVRIGSEAVATRCGEHGRMTFGWDSSDGLAEIVIGPLTNREWEDIDGLARDPETT